MKKGWIAFVALLAGCDPAFELELDVVVPVESQTELAQQMPLEVRLRNVVDLELATRLGVLCEVGPSDAVFEYQSAGVCGEETTFELYLVTIDEIETGSCGLAQADVIRAPRASETRVGPAERVTFFDGFPGGRSSECGEGLERMQVVLD